MAVCQDIFDSIYKKIWVKAQHASPKAHICLQYTYKKAGTICLAYIYIYTTAGTISLSYTTFVRGNLRPGKFNLQHPKHNSLGYNIYNMAAKQSCLTFTLLHHW